MFHLKLNQGQGWDLWPFTFHSFDSAIDNARKLLNYMSGPIQMQLVHDLDGATVWSTTRA